LRLTSEWDRLPIVKRLIPSLRKRAAGILRPHGYGVVKRFGALFLVNFTYWADRGVTTHGVVERDQILYLLAEIRRRQCQIFVDVGANMGIYTIYVARETECRKLLAFEPEQRGYDQLRANLLINGLSERVESRQAAVSDRNGRVPFEPGSPTHNVLSKVSSAPDASRSVPAVRLDDALFAVDQRIALKIDIEGHERAALEGMTQILAENDCFLQVECWPDNAAGFVAAMSARGYRLVHKIDVDHYFARG
jgi:FkbM family methyltransferase